MNSRGQRGAWHPNAKLTATKVRRIRRLRAAGYEIANLAVLFKVSKTTICNAANGKTYKP